MKKFILAAGALTAVVAPVAIVVSCGTTTEKTASPVTITEKTFTLPATNNLVEEINANALNKLTEAKADDYKLNKSTKDKLVTITKKGNEYTTKGYLAKTKEANNGIPTIKIGESVTFVINKSGFTINGKKPIIKDAIGDKTAKFNNTMNGLIEDTLGFYYKAKHTIITQENIHNKTIKENCLTQDIIVNTGGILTSKKETPFTKLRSEDVKPAMEKSFEGYTCTFDETPKNVEEGKKAIYRLILVETTPTIGTQATTFHIGIEVEAKAAP